MKKFILVSDSFKSTLSSSQINQIGHEVFSRFPDFELTALPMSDGGEGTVDCFIESLNYRKEYVNVSGPYFEKMNCYYGISGNNAVIEMASCAGLPLVDKKNPGQTTTLGVGEMIQDAISKGCNHILLGLGGSCSNDGGCGCAYGLGVRFYDENNQSFIPVGDSLIRIHHIDMSNRIVLPQITVMCDVKNPLYGPTGAAYVFAPQKGADEKQVESLDQGLRHLYQIVKQQLSADINQPGCGAAGGLGGGCVAFLNGTLTSGIQSVLNITNFTKLQQDCDYIITGEGKLDHQSFNGKVIDGILANTEKPVIAIVGKSEIDPKQAHQYQLDQILITSDPNLPFESIKEKAADSYRQTLYQLLEKMKGS